MTELIQTLKKIAELDGGFLIIWKYQKTTLYNFKTKSRGVECDSVDLGKASYQDLIFGAICEKVEAEGWFCEFETRKIKPKYNFTVYTGHSCYHSKYSHENLTTAAAKALLAALEAKQVKT